MSVPITFEIETFEVETPAWLRNLRWLLIAGIAVITALAAFLGAQFESNSIFFLLGVYALWNQFLPWIEQRFEATVSAFVFLQITVDLLAVTAVLWLSGGLSNPFVGIFAVNVLVAGLLLGPLLTILISSLAVLCVLFLLRAPPIVVDGSEILLRNSPIWIGVPMGIIFLILLTTGFILVFLKRLRRAQGAARQKLKMDALGRLVAGLAHEIGTPLNSILLLSQGLEDEMEGRQKKELGLIANQARRCGEIVSLLLGYSRTMVRSSEEVRYTPVSIVAWIREIYEILVECELQKFPERRERRVEFQITAYGVPEMISVPQLILRQVLENLFKNARDATSLEREAKILVELSFDSVRSEWIFIVSDNGPGFGKEEQEKAFEAFFTTKKQGFGSGLGLYISYYLLSQVGGRIVIDGHSGHGARMRVTLPKQEGLDDQDRVGARKDKE